MMSEKDPNYKNWNAFTEERESLLVTHRNQYAAYYDGQRVSLGPDKKDVYNKARDKAGTGVILVQQIIPQNEMPVIRLRSPRIV